MGRRYKLGVPPRFPGGAALSEPPVLSHGLAMILQKLDELGADASGAKVLSEVSLDIGVMIDHAQIYSSIKTLRERGYIEMVREIPQKGSPALRIYKVTKAGKAALEATSRHHAAMQAYLTK